MLGDAPGQRRAGLRRLCPHLSGGPDGERQQLRRVAASRGDVEHLHAGLHLRERQELGGMAGRVDPSVLVGADGACDDALVTFRGGTGVLGGHRRAAAQGRHDEKGAQEARRRERAAARRAVHRSLRFGGGRANEDTRRRIGRRAEARRVRGLLELASAAVCIASAERAHPPQRTRCRESGPRARIREGRKPRSRPTRCPTIHRSTASSSRRTRWRPSNRCWAACCSTTMRWTRSATCSPTSISTARRTVSSTRTS